MIYDMVFGVVIRYYALYFDNTLTYISNNFNCFQHVFETLLFQLWESLVGRMWHARGKCLGRCQRPRSMCELEAGCQSALSNE